MNRKHASPWPASCLPSLFAVLIAAAANAQVVTTTDQELYASGATVGITITNNDSGPVRLANTGPYFIEDLSGVLVWQPDVAAQVIIDLDPAESYDLTWDQTDQGDEQVADGCYRAVVNWRDQRYREMASSSLFAIGAAVCPGTTIINHGWTIEDVPSAWMFAMADAIQSGHTGGTVFVYQPATGRFQYHSGSGEQNAELILVLDWTNESDGISLGGRKGWAVSAADAFYASLVDPDFRSTGGARSPVYGIDAVENGRRIHFIGHSRGTSSNSALIERMAVAGIEVDQATSLDPHPVDMALPADWEDPPVAIWSNVVYADHYRRRDQDNPSDYEGFDISNSADLSLQAVLGDDEMPDVDVLPQTFEHVKNHAWYHGTIEACDVTVDSVYIDCAWYGGGLPARMSTGYYYSAVIGGTRLDEGLRTVSGGTAARETPTFDRTSVFNGNFELGTGDPMAEDQLAGWKYHGGNMTGTWSAGGPDGSVWYATLEALTRPTLQHNRLHADQRVVEIAFDLRIPFDYPSHRLEVELVEANDDGDEESAHLLFETEMSVAPAWTRVSGLIPVRARGRSHLLVFRIDGDTIAGPTAEIDNISFVRSEEVARVGVPALSAAPMVLVAAILIAGTGYAAVRKSSRCLG